MTGPSNQFPKFNGSLSAAHTRALAARLKTVEDFCGEVERLIEARSTIFTEYKGSVAGNEKERIQAILRQVRERLHELRECFRLPREEVKRYSALNAFLSELWVCLSETQSRHLNAYGPTPAGLAESLDWRIASIDALVKELQEVVRVLRAREAE